MNQIARGRPRTFKKNSGTSNFFSNGEDFLISCRKMIDVVANHHLRKRRQKGSGVEILDNFFTNLPNVLNSVVRTFM